MINGHRGFRQNRDSIRHVMLEESVQFIADAMEWELDNVETTLMPVKAETKLQSDARTLTPVSCGQQVGRGYVGSDEVITLVFKAAVGIEESRDTINVSGVPDFVSTIEGGINGDIATAGVFVNAIQSLDTAPDGLITMLDVAVPAYYSNR
ncbi:MAG: hypothetical protein U5J63_06985 [Fodinibius sp.]|nr:hypothetical protein [Fodinibius sp.]